MNNLQCRLYGVLVRLHPAAFRNEFGREMRLDFEDALERSGFAALCLDALLSLGRQWTVRAFPGAEEHGCVARPSLLAGQYVMVSPGGPTLFELARASVVATTLFFAIGFSATISNKAITNDLQSVPSSQEGNVQSGVDHRSSTGGKEGRTAGQGDREYSCIRSYDLAPCDAAVAGKRSAGDVEQTVRAPSGAPDHDWQAGTGRPERQRADTKGAEEQGSRMTARTLSSVRPLLRDHLGQLIELAIIAWLMTLLLRRNPSMGKKLVLAALGLLAIAAPLAFGLVRMIPVHGQILHASEQLPSFEVATIRPWKPMPGPLPTVKYSPVGGAAAHATDRVHFIGQAVLLIASAYNLPVASESRIVGGPDWMGSESSNRYEIQAKIEDSRYAAMQTMSPAQQSEQVDLMEQSLLADRFKLKVHFEKREMPVYALVVAKGGPKLTPAESGESSKLFSAPTDRGSKITAEAVTLDDFANSPLLSMGGRLVVNQTGLKGTYDFTLESGPDRPVAPDAGQEGVADAPSFFTAVQEQLGLRLVPTKAPVEVIVIDHIEKPSEN